MLREAAMSSMARVIFLVDSVDLIRARYSRSDAAIGAHLPFDHLLCEQLRSAPLLDLDLLLFDLVVLQSLGLRFTARLD